MASHPPIAPRDRPSRLGSCPHREPGLPHLSSGPRPPPASLCCSHLITGSREPGSFCGSPVESQVGNSEQKQSPGVTRRSLHASSQRAHTGPLLPGSSQGRRWVLSSSSSRREKRRLRGVAKYTFLESSAMSQLSDPTAQEVSEGNKCDRDWQWDKSFEIWERALHGAHRNRKGL